MSDRHITVNTELFIGRGLRAAPEGTFLDETEISVDLRDLGPELGQALLRFEVRPQRAWLPLTTVVSGEPELVWNEHDGLIPTHVPVGDEII